MNVRRVAFSLLFVGFATACGGSVFKDNDGTGGGRGGSSSTGASSSSGGATHAGASALGGAAGGVATAGAPSIAGAPGCAAANCAAADCTDAEVPVLLPGACCETCRPRAGACEDVKCQPVESCGDGYELAQPPGACCVGCVPTGGSVACREIACPPQACPLGYVRGDLLGGCCYDCVPDPLYCRDGQDCVVADKPRACCGCPEAITRRQYEAEPCWSELGAPRAIPESCYPDAICDAVCGACQDLSPSVVCSESRCVPRQLGLK